MRVVERLPGAGSYGDPRERAPEALAADISDGKVTPAHARRDFHAMLEATTKAAEPSAQKRHRRLDARAAGLARMPQQ